MVNAFASASVLALVAPFVLAQQNDGAFAASFNANLTTAANGQLAAAIAAQKLIDGNTTGTNNNNFGGKGSNGVSQDSLTLDASQVMVGAFIDGQSNPGSDPGQVKSLTSKNNFINFCATQKMILSNGVQTRGAPTCNSIVMGAIPSSDLIPTTAISNPLQGATLKSQTPINFQIRTTNMDFGNFVNAQSNYFTAPQQLSSDGKIVGHSHFVCNTINGIQDTTNVNSFANFMFFKGLNQGTFNGVLSTTAPTGFPAGTYRCCTMTAASNHQPVLVGVAQRISQDDCVRFTVADNGDAKQNVGDQDAANQQKAQAAQQATAFAQAQAALLGGSAAAAGSTGTASGTASGGKAGAAAAGTGGKAGTGGAAGDKGASSGTKTGPAGPQGNIQNGTTKNNGGNGNKHMGHHGMNGHRHMGSAQAKRDLRREVRRSRQQQAMHF